MAAASTPVVSKVRSTGYGGLPVVNSRLDVMRQRIEEIGERLAGRKAGKIHLRRERLAPSGDSNGDGEIVHQP